MNTPSALQKWAQWLGLVLTMRHRKYIIATAVFVVWVAFIDSNNLLERIDALAELHRLHQTKAYFEQKVIDDTHLLNELKTNNDVLEKYAREKYLMKRENEDIFLIVEK